MVHPSVVSCKFYCIRVHDITNSKILLLAIAAVNTIQIVPLHLQMKWKINDLYLLIIPNYTF